MDKRERRSFKRVRKRVKVRYGVDGLDKNGMTADVSAGGLFLGATSVHLPGCKLHLQLLPEDRDFFAEGVVMHVRRVPAALRRTEKQGMGIAFCDPAELVRELLQSSSMPMAAPEASADRTLIATYKDWPTFQSCLQQQLCAGALAVPIEGVPPQLQEVVSFRIQLDFLTKPADIHGTGRVVSILDGLDADNRPRAVLDIEKLDALARAIESAIGKTQST